jgi:membrane protein implicated in regulation of membrane protease activity
MDAWFYVWAGLTAALIVGEIFTAGFFLLPFGIGAAVAAALNYAELSLGWQWAAFLAVSAAALFSLRRFSDRVTHEPPEKAGVDRLLGKTGIVLQEVEGGRGGGMVRIEREEWRADAEDGKPISEGTRVSVVRVDGTHLVVRPVESGPREE